MQPVLYEGAWFRPLNSMPDIVHTLPTGRYQLNKAWISVWTYIKETLTIVVRTLKKKNTFRCLMPFAPEKWKHDAIHHTEEAALMHIKNGRDWFAMWIGLLYWMTRKSINPASFVEGISAPTWFIQLVQELPLQQAIWDLVWTAPLLQRSMRWNWVGIWLHHLADVNGQPSVQWFVDQCIPVWYRWGHREDQSNQNPFFALISPSAKERQSATTLIFSALSMYLPVDVVPLNTPHGESAALFLNYNHFHKSFPTGMPDYHHFGKTSKSAIQDLPGEKNNLLGSGEQKAMLSWYPHVSVFKGQGLDMGWWTDHAELLWETTTKGIVSSEFVLPLNYMKWRDKVQGHGDARRALSKLEGLSRKFLDKHVGQL
ncbi:hypothetical protein AN958_03204 [Leucoagaricus sp. SymC.cos]|nr:hypothetical protein AN958_03204 [Leucoagaricus sp. SymC.cos]